MTGCASDKVLNPATGRCVQRTGAVGRRLAGAAAPNRRLSNANGPACPRPLDPSVHLVDELPAGTPAATERAVARVEDGMRHGHVPRPGTVKRILGALGGEVRGRVATYVVLGVIACVAIVVLPKYMLKALNGGLDFVERVQGIPLAALEKETALTGKSAAPYGRFARKVVNVVSGLPGQAKQFYYDFTPFALAVEHAKFSEIGKSILQIRGLPDLERVLKVLKSPSFRIKDVKNMSPHAVSPAELCAVYGHLMLLLGRKLSPTDMRQMNAEPGFIKKIYHFLGQGMKELTCPAV